MSDHEQYHAHITKACSDSTVHIAGGSKEYCEDAVARHLAVWPNDTGTVTLAPE